MFYTIEFTHNGIRRFMETDATTEQKARQAFEGIKRAANAEVELHYETLLHHANAESMKAATAAFRTAQGKSPAPTPDELVENAVAVLSKPILDPEDIEDDDADE